MRRLTNRLYYYLESYLTRGPFYQLMLLASLIAMLSVVGGIFVHITNPKAYSNTLEAMWWAFLRLTDPGYLGADSGFIPRLTSMVLTMAGYVFFLGALVALMTNWLDRTLQYLASGRSQIFEEGHVLIIGWNDRIHALIEEVAHSDHLSGQNDSMVSIVILCEPYSPSMHRELMQKIDPAVRGRCRVLIRSGDPLEAESLARVDFAHARAIILVSGAGSDRAQRSLSDVTLAKVVMSMKALAPDLEHPPNVVVEVANPGNKLLVESVGWEGRTEAVVADLIMGRLFCQALRFPRISKVYHRLLTDTFGYSLTLQSAHSLGVVGKTLRDIVLSLEVGTPIGALLPNGGEESLKLLELEHVFSAGERVVVVRSKTARDKRHYVESTVEGTLATVQSPYVERKILIAGWSTDLFTLLVELAANTDEMSDVTLLWERAKPSEKDRLEHWAKHHQNFKLEVVLGTLLDQDAVNRADIDRYNKILLLADQTQPALVADAENILRFVLLDRYITSRNLQVDVVVELNDEDNRPLLSSREADVLMTGEILSHLLAQVSTHRSLMGIYEELFTKGGAELRLRPIKDLGKDGAHFHELQPICLNSSAIALGYYRHNEVVFNPDPGTALKGSDLLILVEME